MNSPFNLSNHIDGDLDIACDDILKLINSHQEFLFQEENLKLLAYLIWRWESLYNNGRIAFPNECTNSPMNELEHGNVIKYLSKDKIKLAKTAWKVITSENYSSKLENKVKDNEYFSSLKQPVYDEWDILYWKKNKTLDEWVVFLSNPKHKNFAIYQNKYSIYNHLLCSIGSAYKWNKQGFLDSSIKTHLFSDFIYAKDLLPSDIKLSLEEIVNRPKCILANKNAWEITEYNIEEEMKKRLHSSHFMVSHNNISLTIKEKYEIYSKEIDEMVLNRASTNNNSKYSIFNQSRFFSAPKNLDESYVNGIRKIAFDILKKKHLYTKEELDTLQNFIIKNPQWFRKKTIENLLKN